MKTHAYVDGFNLYRGMMDWSYNMPGATSKPVLRQYLWLDLHAFISSFFVGDISLEHIHYCTAPVRDSIDGLERQEKYWKAQESLSHQTIHKGVYARRFDRKGNFLRYEEKQSDARFGIQATEDALREPGLERMVTAARAVDR